MRKRAFKMSATSLNSSVFPEVTEEIHEAQSLLSRAHEKMEQEAENLRREREEFEETRKKLDHVHFSKSVKLNVGGKIYKTSLETLQKESSSMLAAMFSGRFDVKPDQEDGAYFIDRDGELFRYILNFLRNGELFCPETELSEIRAALKAEALFFQIPSLVEALTSPLKVFPSSTILVRHQEKVLLSFLPATLANSKWTLAYKATTDGWDPEVFHERCDDRAHSLVIAQSAESIFGGYTDLPWGSPESESFLSSPNTFLFTLINPGNANIKKVLPKPTYTEEASAGGIICDEDRGPAFGSDTDSIDLGIMGNPSNYRIGLVRIGNGFALPRNCKPEYFTGAVEFLVEEVEVFVLELS